MLFVLQILFISIREDVRVSEVATDAVRQYCDLCDLAGSKTSLWTFLVEIQAFPSLPTLARILQALPKQLLANPAKKYLAALRAASGRTSKCAEEIKWLKHLRDFVDVAKKSNNMETQEKGQKLLADAEKANYSFKSDGNKLTLAAPDLQQKIPLKKQKKKQPAAEKEEIDVEQEEENAEEEEKAEGDEEREKEIVGKPTSGSILVEDVFSAFVGKSIADAIEQMSDLFVGIDVPYFVSKNIWDSPAFVGKTEADMLLLVSKMVTNIFKKKNGMAIVFASLAQIPKLKALFQYQREKSGNISGIQELVIYRKRYRPVGLAHGNRPTLVNNIEMALQVSLFANS
jgi:hypothetical protein